MRKKLTKITFQVVLIFLFSVPRSSLVNASARVAWRPGSPVPVNEDYNIYSSRDGLVLLAAVANRNTGTIINKSTDGGVSWSLFLTHLKQFTDMALSPNGKSVVAIAYDGGFYIYDGNVSNPAWALAANSGYLDKNNKIFMSPDGTHLVSTHNGNSVVWVSIDGGHSWLKRTPPYGVGEASISNNGVIIANGRAIGSLSNQFSTDNGLSWGSTTEGFAVAGSVADSRGVFYGWAGALLYKTINNGASWTKFVNVPQLASARQFYGLAVSDDGNILAARNTSPNAGTGAGNIFLSVDGGNTWSTEDDPGSKAWIDLDVSGDGSKIMAVNIDTPAVYVGENSNIPSLKVISPVDQSKITSTWAPKIFWAAATVCEYKFNSDPNFLTANCLQDNGGIRTPTASPTEQTLTVRINGTTNVSARFTYNPVNYTWRLGSSVAANENFNIYSSRDGSVLLSAVANRNTGTIINKSTDGGASWSSFLTHPKQFTDIALSPDGKRVVAIAYDGGFYIYDGNVSNPAWALVGNAGYSDNNNKIFMSPDGTRLVSTHNGNSFVWVSLDGGHSWVKRIPTFGVGEASISNNGVIIANGRAIGSLSNQFSTENGLSWGSTTEGFAVAGSVADSGGVFYGWSGALLYKTINNGTSWTKFVNAPELAVSRQFYELAVSDDGNILIARDTYAGSPGNIYLSVDGGNTWTKEESPGYKGWVDLDVSGDGNTLIAINVDTPAVYVANQGGAVVVNDTTPPTVPGNLKVTSLGSTQISLSWDASTDNFGVTGYRLFRNGIKIVDSLSRSFTDSGLTASTPYTYTVVAYDAKENQSALSGGVQATTLTVGSNNPPTISGILDQRINVNNLLTNLPFTIGDVESGPNALTLSAQSSNQSLVPNENIVLGGSGASRLISLSPASGQIGTVVITITVNDGSTTANNSFTLTVVASSSPNRDTLNENTELKFSKFINSFNPSRFPLTINYSAGGDDISLIVKDRNGSEIKSLDRGSQTSGGYQTTWDGTNNSGSVVGSGMYVLVLKQGGNVVTKKIVVVR